MLSHCLFYAAWKDDKPIDTIEVEAATGHLATPTATAQKSTVKESKLLVQSGSAAGIITKAIGRALPSCVFRQGKVTFISKVSYIWLLECPNTYHGMRGLYVHLALHPSSPEGPTPFR